MTFYPAKVLDEKGRCCGRKPIVYKRPPYRFCCRCSATFHPHENRQISNWAFDVTGDQMEFKHPHMEARYLEARKGAA